MMKGRAPRSKTHFPFWPFSLIFCRAVDSLLYHAPKKLALEGVDHNSVVVNRVINISILKEKNDHIGSPLSQETVLDNLIENSVYVSGKKMDTAFWKDNLKLVYVLRFVAC